MNQCKSIIDGMQLNPTEAHNIIAPDNPQKTAH